MPVNSENMHQKIQHLGPLSFHFWKAYGIQMRPYLLFVSGVAGWAGISLASDDSTTIWLKILVFIPLFLGYGFGQALTDCFQMDTDALSAPSRPLSMGLLSKSAVITTSLTGLIIISAILIFLNPWNLILCCLSVFGLATYTYVKKNITFGGPFYNAWIVALLPLMGYISISGKTLLDLSNRVMYLLLLLSFFAYASFVLIGYLKDIKADKKAGYATFTVVFGWNRSILVSIIFLSITIFICYHMIHRESQSIFLLGLAAIISTAGHVYGLLTKNKTENNAMFPVSATLRSFILFHLAVILSMSETPLWLVLLFYLLFEIFFYFRPDKNQI